MTYHDGKNVCDLSGELEHDDRGGDGVCGGTGQSSCSDHSVTTGGYQLAIDTIREGESHQLTNKTTKGCTWEQRTGGITCSKGKKVGGNFGGSREDES